ncbi:MAG: FHA domain-containing protein [Bacteroidetes Order II. Incertae sedis bacterium]|nr:FHA domain-containing protein [Bacteroidetes Order II. bacterium]
MMNEPKSNQDESLDEEPETLVLNPASEPPTDEIKADEGKRPEQVPAAVVMNPLEPPIPLTPKSQEEGGSLFKRLFGKLSKPKDVVEAIENLIPQEKSTLEIRYEMVELVEQTLRPHRRRGVVLPYNLALIHIVAETPQEQQKYVAAISDLSPSLQDAVLEKLISGRFNVPEDFQVDVLIYPEVPAKIADAFTENRVYVELAKRTAATLVGLLTVIKGLSGQTAYKLQTNQAYNIGRLEEIMNPRGHLVRQNQIYFSDPNALPLGDANRSINDTVSRMHGKIQFDNKKNKFVYYNEQGTTSFFRTGYTSSKKLATGQSVALEPGDVLYLGSACIRFDG